MADDRIVHAEDDRLVVVRYERSGKWYIESAPCADSGSPQLVTVDQAAAVAVNIVKNGGKVHVTAPGGRTFRRRYRGLVYS